MIKKEVKLNINTAELSNTSCNCREKTQNITSNFIHFAFNRKGITLIALIITIIIMLILVGVSVRVALNGGLFDTAKEATRQTQISELMEMIQVDIVTEQMKNKGKITSEKLKEIFDKYFKDVPNPLPEDLTGVTVTAKDDYGGYKDIPLSEVYSGNISNN